MTATGRDVLDLGPAATPTVGFIVRERGAAGGIQISASHNPPEYNGLKFFQTGGMVLGPEAGTGPPGTTRPSRVRLGEVGRPRDGSATRPTKTTSRSTTSSASPGRSTSRPSAREASAWCSTACHGAGSTLGRALPRRLGAAMCRSSAASPTADTIILPSRPRPTSATSAAIIAGSDADVGLRAGPRRRPPGDHRRNRPLHRRRTDAGPGGPAGPGEDARQGGHQPLDVPRRRGRGRATTDAPSSERPSARSTSSPACARSARSSAARGTAA